MYLSKNNLTLIALPILLLVCGCSGQGKKKDSSNSEDTNVAISPSLGVSAVVPNDLLYKRNSISNASSKSNLVLTENTSKNLYRAVGNGGLEAALDSDNDLIEYQGIPINIQKKDLNTGDSLNISIDSKGDTDCDKIFTYDNSTSLIKIDSSYVNNLKSCDININAIGFSNGKILKDSKTVTITLNPTMAYYAANNDPIYSFISKFTSLKDLNLMAKWLNKPEQSANLKIDPKIITDKIFNLNALTGAKNIKSLDLSYTDLNDLRALLFMPNLERLNLTGTKISNKDLNVLSNLKNLKSITLSNLNINDLKAISKNFPNIEELDISNNKNIKNISEIANLKNLKSLKASNIGITSLKDMGNLLQINNIDLSNNDLSMVDENDIQNLINLTSITSLDLSNTNIKDSILNKYFDSISNQNILTKLTIRNNYNRNVIGGCEKINIIDDIPNLSKLTNLSYLDLHGNGCNDTNVSQKGLTSSLYFSNMKNLQYLDISNTPVKDLSNLTYSYLRNLKTLILVDERGNGISLSKEQCSYYLGTSERGSDCNKLADGISKSLIYNVPSNYQWKVPANVWSIKVTGCSGANGGAGGGGGGAAGAKWGGSWGGSSWGGNGGTSGNVNGSGAGGGQSGRAGQFCYQNGDSWSCVPTNADHVDAWQHGKNGSDGGLGSATIFGGQIFSLANSNTSSDSSLSCFGGASGSGGEGG
ncbi:leucine-rich repeat domain-containing protein, partial [Silvanigrella aquatica]|uniref:leucine-rich repeat domain-containing protein n=1 Tax=Silvanigrella aquatica TaxID=1915309 RepID=UPI0011E5FC09